MALKLDCRDGTLFLGGGSDGTLIRVQAENVLQHLTYNLNFENGDAFTLRTIKRLLVNYPDLLKISNWGYEFLRLAEDSIPRIGIIKPADEKALVSLVLRKTKKVIQSELTLTATNFIDLEEGGTVIKSSFSNKPSCEVRVFTGISGCDSSGEHYSLGYLNLRDLLHLPVVVENATVEVMVQKANAELTEIDESKSTYFELTSPEINLSDLLFSVYMDIDLYDPEDNQEEIDLIRERMPDADE